MTPPTVKATRVNLLPHMGNVRIQRSSEGRKRSGKYYQPPKKKISVKEYIDEHGRYLYYPHTEEQ